MKLFDAIESGDLPGLRRLMRQGVDLNLIDEESGVAPLALAAECGHNDIVRVLLKAGADPDWGGVTTPLEAATLEGHVQVAATLLKSSADVNRPVGDGFTPLITAASLGNTKMVQLLLDNGANVTVVDDEGDNALTVAQKKGFEDVAELISGFESHNGHRRRHRRGGERSKDNIFYAIEDRDIGRLNNCLENGGREKLGDRDRRNRTPLGRAAQLGHLTLVRALLKGGAEIDAGGARTPLLHAVENAHEPVVRELLAAGANVNETNNRRKTPLMAAAASGNIELIRLLMDNGADPLLRDDEDRSALWYAGNAGRQQAFNLLASHFEAEERQPIEDELRSYVEWREKTAQSASRLPDMLNAGEVDRAKRYIASGIIDPDGFDEKGRTALMIAAGMSLSDVVRMLISVGASFEAEDDEGGWTALIHAIHGQGADPQLTISILASASANLNHASWDGRTPLMHAVDAYLEGENEDADAFARLAEPLLHLGADPSLRDKDGHTAWTRVREMSADEATPAELRRRLERVRRVLQKAGVRTEGSLSSQLLAATSEGQSALLADLLSRGQRERILDMPLLSVAADNNRWEAVNALVEWGFDINTPNGQGETILMQAAVAGHEQIVEHLLMAGADPSAKNEERKTAAALADNAGFEEIGKIIRKAARAS